VAEWSTESVFSQSYAPASLLSACWGFLRVFDAAPSIAKSYHLNIERRLRRINGYRHVQLLRAALPTEIMRAESQEGISVA